MEILKEQLHQVYVSSQDTDSLQFMHPVGAHPSTAIGRLIGTARSADGTR